MAVDMFIKIGDLKGESADHKHKEEIDVLSWSFGAANNSSGHTGGGQGAGKVRVQDLAFTKWTDISTPDLMLHCCNGKHIAEAKLTVRKAGEKPLEYLIITMTDVLVTSVSQGGNGGEDRLTENISLNFSKVKIDYVEQTAKGDAGKKPTMTWDIKANKAG